MSKPLTEAQRENAYRDVSLVYVLEIREKLQGFGDRTLGTDRSGESEE